MKVPWKKAKLGDHCKIFSGVSPTDANAGQTGTHPFLKVEDLNNCRKYQSTSRFFTNHLKAHVPPRCLIFPKRGAAIANNKVRINDCAVLMDSNLMALRTNPVSLDAEFLFYLILYEGLWKIADTSTIPQINNKHISPYKIPLPPLSEQKKIAKILGACDEAIEAQERLIALKQQRKKGLMQQLLTGKTRFPQFAGNPWREVRVGEIGEILKGKGISKADCLSVGEFRAIRYAQIYTKHNTVARNFDTFITEKTATQSLLLHAEDIVFTSSGETAEEIGKSAVYLDEPPCYASGDTLVLRQTNENSLFLAYFLNTGAARSELNRRGQGNSVVHLYKRDLESLSFKIPTRDEQAAIATVLSAADEEITLQQTKLEQLKQQKKGLMQQLLTGKVRVKI